MIRYFLEKLLQPQLIERLFWIVLILCLTAATYYVTNYRRDHDEFEQKAHECRSNVIKLEGEVDKLKAENFQLKSQPLR